MATSAPNFDTSVRQPARLLSGSVVATPHGLRDVAALRRGDLVVTGAGETLRIARVSHHEVDATSQAHPETLWPVRICRDAFGPGSPARDLMVAPETAVCLPEAVIPIRCLVNGANVARVLLGRFTCCEIVLQAQGAILANGLAFAATCEAESFAFQIPDDANRHDLGTLTSHSGNDAARRALPPVCLAGEPVDAARNMLRRRAVAMGFVITNDPAPCLHVDGQDIVPAPALALGGETVWQFRMPAGARQIRLRSRMGYALNDPPDTFGLYPLGLKLSRIVLRAGGGTTELDLSDDSLFGACYAAEHWNERTLRWTSGEALIRLPSDEVESVEVHSAATPEYWTRERPHPTRRVA